MSSLYELGWRQGTLLRAELPMVSMFLASDGSFTRQDDIHRLWVVASQDCDLAGADETVNDPMLELRPVFTEDPPGEIGIRSRRFLLSETYYVVAEAPKLTLSPAVLASLRDERTDPIEESRARGFKKWLGLRYDRPAVPPQFVALARRIAKEVSRKRYKQTASRIRDVMMQFGEGDPPSYSLFAVTERQQDVDDARNWLAEVALGITASVGNQDRAPQAATSDETSWSLIETSYAADVTQVTWSGYDPEGAE